MEPTRSPPVGFSWSPIIPNHLPTPIPHDLMDFSTPFQLTGMQSVDSMHYTDERRVQNPSHKVTPGPSGLGQAPRQSDHARSMSDENMRNTERNRVHAATRRNKHADLDWEGNRKTLHELYIRDGLILTETMEIMKRNHNFDATVRAYKEKFKLWGWRRNLSGEVAHWMVDRAKERQATGKRTEFEFGGQRWSLDQARSTANRTKKTFYEDITTPEGVKVVSPESHCDLSSPGGSEIDMNYTSPSVVFVAEESVAADVTVPLNFNGKSISDLGGSLLAARCYAQNNAEILAEEAYIEAFKGFQHLLGSTHPDATKVGYELATFYWQQSRKVDADATFEGMTAAHVSSLGMDNRRTQQYILHVAELLNSWRRGEDALAFLSHARELAESAPNNRSSGSDNSKRKETVHRMPLVLTGQDMLLQTSDEIVLNPSLHNINQGLDNARVHATVQEPAVVVLLRAIESQCFQEAAKYATQGMRARAELLKFHLKQGLNIGNKNDFLSAKDVLNTYWTNFYYDSTSFKSQEALEAALELTAAVLRGNFDIYAMPMFRTIEQKAQQMFGSEDERTIWMFINIGIIYQTYRRWDDARPWFERAWAAADSVWGFQDGVTRSLTNAFAKKHFSYISDEGRPFKTVFGVCGFTVRPTRLHIE